MHEAKNFSTYFPVIFCLESGSSVTKNLEAVRAPPCPSCPAVGDIPVPLTRPLCPAVPADLRPRGGQRPCHRLRAGGHGGGPDAPQRPAHRGPGAPAPVRALDHHQWGTAGGQQGARQGWDTLGTPPDRPCVPPQKHTDELQAQAEASLLGLVCHLYQVGQGSGGTAGLGDVSPSLVGLYWLLSLAGGEARGLWGLKGPEDPVWLQALTEHRE